MAEPDKLKSLFPAFLSGIANSYSQIFFSDNKFFAVILMLISFFDVYAGLSGLIAVMVSNLLAYIIGFNRYNIKQGYYGFNSLLVGLGIGVYYEPGLAFFTILVFATILTLFLTLGLEGIIGKYGLPYLSLPFLLGLSLVTLAARQFTSLQVSESGLYQMNELYSWGGQTMVDAYNWFNTLNLPEFWNLYFKSLGAIFFQYHLFAGILVALGLIIYSRIAFMLSLLGFFSAWLYYQFIGADITELSYGYIGFNFILTSIAIGGFFIIPSRWSFVWVILLTPLISIILTSTYTIFSLFQLSIYSLPFNVIVLLFLYSLKLRERFFTKPELVSYQQNSPEKNLYSHINYKVRFGGVMFFPFALPFWGKWKITQGHSGSFTHKDEWRHAWDFEVTDDDGLAYSDKGEKTEDYYGYNKPVLAPAGGWVEEITDGYDDNEIGSMDLEHNWGNTIILRHTDQLYSKLSHLKKESFKVVKGETVYRGQHLANCGNSGRSPVPHIHFQIQTTPYIGSKTTEHPISHYILHQAGKFELKSYDIPANDKWVSNISRNSTLEKAFHLIPGQMLKYQVRTASGNDAAVSWEVQVDSLNNTCLYCQESGSRAWFRNDGDLHYFTHFEGNKSSLLYLFFLSAYKVMLGYYNDLLVTDYYPVHAFNNPVLTFIQDFIAPFWIFTRAVYHLQYLKMEDELMQSNIRLRSETMVKIGRWVTKRIDSEMFISPNGIESFIIHEKGKSIAAKLIPQ